MSADAARRHLQSLADPQAHTSYYNERLDDYFCVACGDYWPCIPHRATVTCKCSHTQAVHSHGTGDCWSLACGCGKFRLRGAS